MPSNSDVRFFSFFLANDLVSSSFGGGVPGVGDGGGLVMIAYLIDDVEGYCNRKEEKSVQRFVSNSSMLTIMP